MSTGLIIAIIVVVLIILALLVLLPRMRRQAEVRKRERELQQRRERVATEHQQVATEREREAAAAEQKAREAQAAAERQRAEARMHSERASMHERGLADDQLIEDHERDHFQPALDKRNASETKDRTGGGGLFSRDKNRDGVDDRDEAATGDTSVSARDGGRAHEPTGSTAA